MLRLFCLFAGSLHQKLPLVTLETILSQRRYFKHLKFIKNGNNLVRPPTYTTVSLIVAEFSDASRTEEIGQLSYVAGKLIGPFQKSSFLYALSWNWHGARGPVQFTPHAETRACSGAIKQDKTVKSTSNEV